MLTRRVLYCLAGVAVAALFDRSLSWSEAPPARGIRAVLELRNREFFYAGDPFEVRLTLVNDGDEALPNPVPSRLAKGFEVRTPENAQLKAEDPETIQEPERPETLDPGARYSLVADLASVFPGLRNPGVYVVSWGLGDLRSEAYTVRMIPPYDPAKEYEAVVETDEGSFRIAFLQKNAPIAVKAFIDMAHAGFYDGLSFHKVVPDFYVEGGDAAGSGSGAPPFVYPAELAAVSALAGSVLMKPVSPSPPSNGSQFMILLRPEASLAGQATVFGQVVEGLETVRRISKVPSTQMGEVPNFKPLRDVRIRRVAVQEKTAGSSR